MTHMTMDLDGRREFALRQARAQYRSLPGKPTREFFLYVPGSRPARRVVVLMHGISENACEQILRFAPEAEKRGAVLVAPLMQRAIFGRYQQLVDPRTGIRADEALLDILDVVHQELGLPRQAVDIFGFSGGGQFAHRFAFVNPQDVRSCVAVAPGWFSFPDDARPYPQGLAALPTGKQPFDAAAVKARPIHIMVGDQDIVRDASLRRTRELDRQQGRTRLERATRWHAAMRKWGADPRGSLTILQGLGHSFSQAVRDHDLPHLVFNLFDSGEADSPISQSISKGA